MTRIALVIGHNARSQGAVCVKDKRTEYDFNSDCAAAIRDLDPGRYVVLRRTAGTNEIGRAYAEVNASGVVASVELHFNSAAAASATGTETLSSGSLGSNASDCAAADSNFSALAPAIHEVCTAYLKGA